MALVASNDLLGVKICEGGAIGKQVDWQVRACEFDLGGAQPPLQRETETAAIKVDAIGKLGHFDIGMHKDHIAAPNASVCQ